MRAKEFARHIFEQVKSNWCIPVTEHQVYSTAEQKVGVWTDLKPIYKKTFRDSFGQPSTTGTLADKDVALSTYGIADINEIIKVEGMLDYGNGTYTELPWSNSNNVVTLVQIYDKNKIRYRNTYKQNETLFGIITLYYTKTTDTATSPKVPYEPLHEWSTEEKLVGYWDGTPVYGKMFKGTIPNKGGDKVIQTGINRIINMRGVIVAQNGVSSASFPYAYGTNHLVTAYEQNGNIYLSNVGTSNTYDGGDFEIWVEYTKTTD